MYNISCISRADKQRARHLEAGEARVPAVLLPPSLHLGHMHKIVYLGMLVAVAAPSVCASASTEDT